jgi:hypothetical protein
MTPDDKVLAQRMEQIKGRCLHFTGKKNERCEAGVRYDDVDVNHDPVEYESHGVKYTSRQSTPCLTKYNYCGATCAAARFPTDAEAREKAEESARSIALWSEGRKRCAADAKATKALQGSVECPKCNGRLHYSIASTNGHMWGRCATADCLSWME